MDVVQAPRVEEVGENRVRVTVEVPGEAVHHAVEHAASDLAGSLKIPGFRKGRVPMPVLLARVGRQRLMEEAVSSHIGGWFRMAAARARIRPVAQPDYEFALPEQDDRPWTFAADVDVQPKPELPDWSTLEVPRAEVDVPDDLLEGELDALRGAVAELAPVEDRPAQLGDTVVVDLVDLSGESQSDFVVELGTGRIAEEVEREIVGMSSGESKTIELQLGDDQTGTVEVTLKDVKEKVLPALDDDFARTASEFDSLDDLRADIGRRLGEQLEDEAESAFRGAVADALVDASRVEAAGPLVEARTRELLSGLVRSVESRGIPFESYLRLTGTGADELVARMREEAQRSVARELVLEAAADQLDIDVPDEEVDALVRDQAEMAGEDADETLQRFRHDGVFEQIRDDLRLRAALDRVAAEVTAISPDLAFAREQLWTPDKEKPDTETKLWTPASKEPA
jgi:trigger factor